MVSGVIRMVTRWNIMGLPQKGHSVDCRVSSRSPNLSKRSIICLLIDVLFVLFVDYYVYSISHLVHIHIRSVLLLVDYDLFKYPCMVSCSLFI